MDKISLHEIEESVKHDPKCWLAFGDGTSFQKKAASHVFGICEGLKNSHRFYCGDIANLPTLDFTKLDRNTIRLPYPVCYFEFRHGPDFALGVIISESTEHLFTIRTFIKHRGQWNFMPFTIHVSDEIFNYKNIERGVEMVPDRVLYELHKTQYEWIAQEFKRRGEDCVKSFEESIEPLDDFLQGERDWFSELVAGFSGSWAGFIVDSCVTYISVLNCTNIHRVKIEPPLALNKSRIKKGSRPYYSFHVITLDPNRKDNIFESKKLNEEDAQMRLHWRRGHIKNRKSGAFWWNPHLVGSSKVGVIEKEYVYERTRSDA